jgi:hypothetical protein
MKRYLRTAVLLLFGCISSTSFAITGDLNTDNEVNFADFAILSSGWQTTYDADDLSVLAENWLYGHEAVNTAPVIDLSSVPEPNVLAYDHCYIPLSGSDDGLPRNKLAYIITQLPAIGNLYDRADWETSWITVTKLPYQIGNYSNVIVYLSTAAVDDSFKYKVFDGEYYSDEATVSIDVSANSADSLCFEGSGYAVIPDTNDTIDLIDGRGIVWFFRTTKENCGILSKRNASGGYEVRIENGRLRVCLYDSSGPVGCYGRTDMYRVDTGRWYVGAFSYKAGGICIILSGVENDDTWYLQEDYTNIHTGPYANTADLYIGKATGFDNFVGEFDRLRFYSGCTGGGLDLRFVMVTQVPTETTPDRIILETRTAPYDAQDPLNGIISPDVRFMFDEGAGSTFADDKGGLMAAAEGLEWLSAKGNETVPINPLTEKGYRFKKYKRAYDQYDLRQKDNNIIDSRSRY